MKRDTKAQRTERLFDHAARLGFTCEETDQLRPGDDISAVYTRGLAVCI